MTEVRDAFDAESNSAGSAHGSLIWYDLMTPDADASKRFYDAVVGWTIGEPVAEFEGYRMIGRSDGGFAGGVLPLTAEISSSSPWTRKAPPSGLSGRASKGGTGWPLT